MAQITPERMMANIEVLAKQPRVAGTPGTKVALDLFGAAAKAAGFDVSLEEFKSRGLTMTNIIASRRGTAPDAERKVVMASAHLDSVRGAPGANDDGSGTSAMTEILGALSKLPPTPNDVRIGLFDGEELGLLGSREYVRRHADEMGKFNALVDADMIGSPGGGTGFSLGVNTSTSLADVVSSVAQRNAIPVKVYPERHNRSDHASFDRVGVPAVDFGVSVKTINKDDPNYHSKRDTPDKINQVTLNEGGDIVALSIWELAHQSQRVPGSAAANYVPTQSEKEWAKTLQPPK